MAETLFNPEAARWNYQPNGPVGLNPLFSWPPQPRAVMRWYRRAWLPITALTVCFLMAIIAYVWFLPPLQAMKSFQPGWMITVWLLNVIPQIVIAGSLHWWLYIRKGQDMRSKFDRRDLSRNSKVFTFNNQVWDNIWWTLGSALTVATVYQWILYWAMANGWAPVITWEAAPIWFVVWLFFIPMWSGLHFYWTHRLEHHPRLFKYAHAVHHRNVNVGPWSGISNHWFENLLYFTTYFIHFIIASNPLHLLYHSYFQQISPAFSHSGFEKIFAKDVDALRSGDFFHQLHHRHFDCNYGTAEIPFDKWFGSFHDGSVEASARIKAARRQKQAAQPVTI